jgi:hypothetical protein
MDNDELKQVLSPLNSNGLIPTPTYSADTSDRYCGVPVDSSIAANANDNTVRDFEEVARASCPCTRVRGTGGTPVLH